MPYFESENQELYYRQHGKGSTAIVLVHGWYQSGSQAWAALLPFLEKRYRVFILDLPGHGLSPLNNPKEFSVAQVDSLLEAFVGYVKGEHRCRDIFIAGHSYGAFAVQRLVAQVPHIVRGVIAIAAIDDYAPYRSRLKRVLAIPAIFLPLYYRLQALLGLFPYGDRLLLYGKMPADLIPARLAYAYIKNKTLSINASHAYMKAFLNARVPWPEKKISTPLLLIYGERDTLTSSQWATQILSHAHSAEMVVIDKAGHNVQISGAEKVAGHMNRFFEKCLRRATVSKDGTHAKRHS